LAETVPSAKWYHHPIVVLLVLFLVLGPFGLPLLYQSPYFDDFWKTTLTVIVLLYTLWGAINLIQQVNLYSSKLIGF
jgi:hypothetical protein